MARGKKTGGRNFEPGWKGGPGRPKMPEDQKIAQEQLKRMQSEWRFDFAQCFDKFKFMTVDELSAFLGKEDPTTKKLLVPAGTSAIEFMVARAIHRVMKSGDTAEMLRLKSLTCGPELKQIELTGKDGDPLHPMGHLSKDQLLEVYRTAKAIADKYTKEPK